MRTVAVTDLEGAEWRVRVVWAPRWRALARRFGGWRAKRTGKAAEAAGESVNFGAKVAESGGGGGGGGGGHSLGDEIAVIALIFIAFVAAVALFWWVLLPLLLLVLDLAIVLILLAASIVARVLFRRPWTVEATTPGRERVIHQVVGWRAALRRRDEMADSLRRGLRPVG
ncbi:hypothetical protein [Paractinoplanes globisporus]|uniref:Uncharacterized protein n=1 Tax=Paractinoplanes globisporus TaxID=113565 RepID=A0ABW6WDR8_9ACTN|nr:hypothetical protein [Actinoplanes globisporus]